MPIWKRWFVLICVALATEADAAGVSTEPILQLYPGSHWAPARRVAVSPNQRYVATASDDKTVRIWQSGDRKLVQVLRVPIGPGPQGRLYGVAFHPSRALVAIGGTAFAGGSGSVYLFEPLTGELIRAIETGPGEIKRLVWSADGRWLAAGFAAPGALRIFSPEGREVSSVPFRGDCYGIDISPSQTLAATDTSGSVHLFRLSESGTLERLTSVAAPAPTPVSVSFSNDGKQLALVHFSSERAFGGSHAGSAALGGG